MAQPTTNNSRLPRGLRNNNPLNIRKSGTRWQHKITSGTDPDFEQFDSIEWGIRAAFCIVRTYINKYKINTVPAIIARWAPTSENNTAAYIRFVLSKGAILSENMHLDYARHPSFISRLLWAMAWYECGRQLDYQLFKKAYEMSL